MLANPSPTTLRVEALSLGSLSTKLVLWASISSETECRPGQDANGSIAVHPAISEDFSGRPLVVVLAPELQQCTVVHVLIDARAVLDSSGNSLVGLVDSDSNSTVTEQVIIPTGTLTFQLGEVSTTIVISCTLSVPLAGGKSHLVGTGDSEIGLTLTTVVLMDEARIFIFSVVVWEVGTFRRAFHTDAPPLSSTGHVVLARPEVLRVLHRGAMLRGLQKCPRAVPIW